MPKTKAKPKESPPAPPPSPEERQANREAAARLAVWFLSRRVKHHRRVRLVVLREPLATGGVCVGSTLEALARLYPGCEVIGVGVDAAALKARWPAASVKEAASLPPPSLGDRWLYYDPAALEGQGGWRLVRPVYGLCPSREGIDRSV